MEGPRALGLGVVVSLLVLAACGDDATDDLPGEPFVEVPIGDPATATIGAAGGTITSTDGRLTLEFPPGAVAADLDVVVQEIEWEGGRAWSLGPDGTEFDVPVIAILTLTGEEAGTTRTTTVGTTVTTWAPFVEIEHISTSGNGDEGLTVDIARDDDSATYSVQLPHFSWLGYRVAGREWSERAEAPVGESVYAEMSVPSRVRMTLLPCTSGGQEWRRFALSMEDSIDELRVLNIEPTLSRVGPPQPWDDGTIAGQRQQLRCEVGGFAPQMIIDSVVTTTLVDPPRGCDRTFEKWHFNLNVRATCNEDLTYYAMLYDYGPVTASPISMKVDPVSGKQVFTGDSTAGAEITIVDVGTKSTAAGWFGGSPATPIHVLIPGFNPAVSLPVSDGILVIDDGGRIVKLDAAGAILWQNRIGTFGYSYLATTPTGGILAARGANFSGSIVVAELSAAGVALSETSFNAGNYPSALMAHSGGGYVVATPTNLLRVDGTGTILWQKQFSAGMISRLAETSGGGIVVSASGGLRQLAADGSLVWQKQYSGMGIAEVTATATGLLAFGSSNGRAAALVLGADGTVVSAKTYRDTELAGPSGTMGGALLPDGRLVLGGGTSTGQWSSIVTAPDMTVSGCGDAGFGADVAPGTITAVDDTATLTDTAFVRTFPSFVTSIPTVTTTAGTVTATDMCSN